MTELLTPRAAAEYLGVSPAALSLYRRQGLLLPALVSKGRRHLYARADLDALHPVRDLLPGTAAAGFLGMSLRLMQYHVDQGHLRAQVTPGGQRRYAQADLNAFKAAREQHG